MSTQHSEESRRAWDKVAPGYDEFVTPTYFGLGAESLHRAGLRPGMRLLDVASGSGALSPAAARLGAHVTAVDISPVMVERLERRAREEGLDVQARVMHGHALDLADASFDMVASEFGRTRPLGIEGIPTTWRFTVSETNRVKYLRLALRAFAVVFVLGVYPLTVLWPSGWSWHAGQSEYLQMIIAIYATLGVFLWLASQDPERHLSLISFTIWSSVTHGLTMAVQSVANAQHFGHLYGDVPALFVVAAVLGWLSSRALMLRFVRSAASPINIGVGTK